MPDLLMPRTPERRTSGLQRRARAGRPRPAELQIPEQILRIVERRDEVDRLSAAHLAVQSFQISKCGEIVEGEADRVENRHVAIVGAPQVLAAEQVRHLDHGLRCGELLYLPLDPRLRLEFHHDPRARRAQDVDVQFGLAGAIASHGIQVHSGLDHIGRQNESVALVRRHGGDDVRAASRLPRTGARDHL
jgi:hypothetical protein